MEGNSWLAVALTGSAIINHFLQLYKSICAFSGHTDNKRPNLNLSNVILSCLFWGTNGGIEWRWCIVEMFQLKIIPLFPCFKRVTCQEPGAGSWTCFFIYLYSHVVKLMVPIFLVHIWNDLPPPFKSLEEGTRNAFWVMRPPFCLFWTQWLATATCLAVPQAAQQQHPNPPPPKKKSVDLNLPRITCYILFSLTFMQLFIHNYKEFPNTHYSWLLSCLKKIPWGCWPLSVS